MNFIDWVRLQKAEGNDVPLDITPLHRSWDAGQEEMRRKAMNKIIECYGDENGNVQSVTAKYLLGQLAEIRLEHSN